MASARRSFNITMTLRRSFSDRSIFVLYMRAPSNQRNTWRHFAPLATRGDEEIQFSRVPPRPAEASRGGVGRRARLSDGPAQRPALDFAAPHAQLDGADYQQNT